MHITTIFLTTLLCVTLSRPESCVLPDIQRTQGSCTHVKECKFALGRLRVGSPVTRCTNNPRVNVCCPRVKTLAEKKCDEYRDILKAPESFTQPPFKNPKCALDSAQASFIVGGRDAFPFEYPHAASLGYGSNPSSLKYLCGATLISNRFLLTAAHCITTQRYGKPTYAVLGDIYLDPTRHGMKPSPYRKLVKIDAHMVHPEYKSPRIYNDIALLRLAEPVELSRFMLPACIGNPFTSPITNSKKSAMVEACGWGITDAATQKTSDTLQSINITTVETSKCNEIYGLEPDKQFRYPDGILKSQTCATGEDRDTCQGDSGGGLFIRESQCVFHVVGITSIGSKVCGYGNPSVYTTTASYQDWIEKVVWG